MKTSVRFIAAIFATVLLQLLSLPMSATALEALTDSSVQENQWEPAFASTDAEVLFRTAKRETQEEFLADRTVTAPGFHFIVGNNLDVNALYTHINNVQHGREDTVMPAGAGNNATPSDTGSNDYWITYACAYVMVDGVLITHFYSFGYDEEFTDADIQELLETHTSEAYVNKWFTEFANERVAQFPAETAALAQTLAESVSAESESEVEEMSTQIARAPISGILVSQSQTTGFKSDDYHPDSTTTVDVDGDSKIAMTPSVTTSTASLNLVAKKKFFGASIPNMGKTTFSYCSMADCYTNGGWLDLTVTASVTYRFVNSSATTVGDNLRILYESAYYD